MLSRFTSGGRHRQRLVASATVTLTALPSIADTFRSDIRQRRFDLSAPISMKSRLEAGVHFGHQTRRWTPKMRRFIFTERNGIHILDLEQTVQRLEQACQFVRDVVAAG